VACLPPFEGIDETAHYSYIEQIAKTGTLPRLGDKVREDAQDVEDYLGLVSRRLRYHNFFAAGTEITERARRMVKVPRDASPTGEPGRWRNWEAQHPPFYYALLTPAYLLSEHWSLVGQLALLRGLSYFVAWLSLCLAVFVAAKTLSATGIGRTMIIAPALWPFVFPGWFPEMARLGNDSLVTLLVACALAVLACAPIRHWSTWLLLGVICGLGALTKATFLPFLAVIALLLLHRTWRRDASSWQFLGFLATVLALAGWWYFQRSFETGMLFATNEDVFLKEKGGLIAGLTNHFSVDAAARVIPAAGLSFLWGGTGSFVTPPLVAILPLIVMWLLIGVAYIYGLRSHSEHPLVQLIPMTLGFWALAITYSTLDYMALFGRLSFDALGWGGYPGYYLHSIAPALAPIVGIALTTVARHRLGRTAFCLLLSYNVVFLFGTMFMQCLYFAGCGSNDSARFNIAFATECWNDWQSLTDNLDVFSYPLATLWLATGGAIALGWSAWASLTLANSPTSSGKQISAVSFR
jgi:hypothetical protein